jgi:hypothetical protein
VRDLGPRSRGPVFAELVRASCRRHARGHDPAGSPVQVAGKGPQRVESQDSREMDLTLAAEREFIHAIVRALRVAVPGAWYRVIARGIGERGSKKKGERCHVISRVIEC